MKVNVNDCNLVLFNMQIEMIPLLENSVLLTHNCVWLADLFTSLNLPINLVEHKKLGSLAPPILEAAPDAQILQKHHFSIAEETEALKEINQQNKKQIIVAGAESHVCIFQSTIDLLIQGFEVFVLADSISARSRQDHNIAIERLKKTACQLISKEMLFFELIKHSERPDYLDLALKFLDGRYIR